MKFLFFNLILLLAGFPAAFLFSVGVTALIAPLGLLGKDREPSRAIVFPFLGLAAAFQVYFWGLWAAFCAAMAVRYTAAPDVTWDWLYWVAAFGWCVSLIGWFNYKEQQTSGSEEEVRQTGRGACLYGLVAIAAFLVFAFAPSIMRTPYAWALDLVGL